jgi:hypothetical protein
LGVRLEVEEVQHNGGEEGHEDEEQETKPVLEAIYPGECTGKAGDELDYIALLLNRM